ncbi:MAG: histidine kinase dimerization/phospho-acceptor domain-containing protein [bacterium]|jgi:signal transduction histidine kinase
MRTAALSKQYSNILQDYLDHGSEAALLQAYELCRKAFGDGVGLMEIAEIHRSFLDRLLQRTNLAKPTALTIRRFLDFFMENLSLYGMIERGYWENKVVLQRLNRSIQQNSQFLRDVVASVPSGLLIFNGTSGRLILANKIFYEKFRIKPEEISDLPFDSVLQLIGLSDEIRAAIQPTSDIGQIECRGNSPRVGEITLKINRVTRRTEKRNETLLLFEDITGRKRLEQEMARLERLNLIGEIAAGIGHEIRNPMATVRGFLQMFEGKAEYAQDGEFFVLMIEELDRANSIISEFLSLARN